jgi:hypothetical protein
MIETPAPKSRVRSKKERVLLVLLLVATVVLLIFWANSLQKHAKLAEPDGITKPIVYSQDDPSEVPVGPGYSVPAGQPLSVSIGSAGIQGFIQKVGVDQNQAVAVPNNVNLAGWFVDSVLPGSKGLSIIDGHLGGRTQPGIFHDLSKVKVGDKITITFGDKSQKNFTVFKIESPKTSDSAAVLFNQDPKVSSQLNLISCIGTYDKAAATYDQRTIVSAALVE